MACVPLATATLFTTEAFPTSSVSSSLTTIVTTIPDQTFTFTSTICLGSVVATPTTSGTPVTSCTSSTLSTSTSISTGTVSSSVSTVFTTIPVTGTITSPTLTLFSTCPTSSESTANSPPPTTPPPTSSTLIVTSTVNGTTIISTVTTTLTGDSATSGASTISSSAPASNVQASSRGSSHTGAIVGGALGGFLGLLAIAGLAYWFWRKRQRWEDIFETEEDDALRAPKLRKEPPRRGDSVQMTPAPYHYGLVGSQIHTDGPSPPTSPRHSHTTSHGSPPGSFSVPPQAGMAYRPAVAHSAHTSSSTAHSPGPSIDRPWTDSFAATYPPIAATPVRPYAPPGAMAPSAFTAAGMTSPHPGASPPGAMHALPPGARAPSSPPRAPMSIQPIQPQSEPFPAFSAGPPVPGASAPGPLASARQSSSADVLQQNSDGKYVMSASASAQPVVVHQDAGRVDPMTGPSASRPTTIEQPPAYS